MSDTSLYILLGVLHPKPLPHSLADKYMWWGLSVPFVIWRAWQPSVADTFDSHSPPPVLPRTSVFCTQVGRTMLCTPA